MCPNISPTEELQKQFFVSDGTSNHENDHTQKKVDMGGKGGGGGRAKLNYCYIIF
jgi:hypothetical protein